MSSQEYDWIKVNPWRFDLPILANHYEEELYVLSYANNVVYFLGDNQEVIDQYSPNNGQQVFRFISFENVSYAIVSSLSNPAYLVMMDNDYNEIETRELNGDFFEIFSLKKSLVLFESAGNLTNVSIIDTESNVESNYVIQGDNIGITVGDERSYFYQGKNIYAYEESTGFTDTIEVLLHVNSLAIKSDGVISVGGNSEYILEYDPTSHVILDSIFNAKVIDDPIIQQRIFSHHYIDDKLYVSSLKEMEFSTNNGNSWETFSEIQNEYVRDGIQLIRYKDDLVFLSVYGLEKLNTDVNSIEQLNAVEVFNPLDINVVNDSTLTFVNVRLNSTFVDLWKSIDFGINWYKVNTWEVEDFWPSDLKYDVNKDGYGIYYHDSDSIIYSSDLFGEEWSGIDLTKFASVEDVFITDALHYGVLSEGSLFHKDSQDLTWLEVELDSSSGNNWRIIEAQDVFWIVGENEALEKLFIYQFSDDSGFLEIMDVEAVLFDYLQYDTVNEGDLVFSTGTNLAVINSTTFELDYFCDEFGGFEIFAYHSSDSIFIVRNDTLFLSTTGCAEGSLVAQDHTSTAEYFFPFRDKAFNSKFQGFCFLGREMWVYNSLENVDFYPTAIVKADQLSNNQWIHAFPNPTDGMLYFQSGVDVDSYQVYSIDGILLKSEKSSEVNVSELVTGVYFVVLDTSTGVRYCRVVRM